MATNQTAADTDTSFGMSIGQATAVLGQIGAFLIALTGVSTEYDKYEPFYNKHPRPTWEFHASVLVYLLYLSVGAQAVLKFRKSRRDAITLIDIQSVGYFRLDPVVTAIPHDFRREDGAHNGVLRWIRATTRPVLFLSGVSGSGKGQCQELTCCPCCAQRVGKLSRFVLSRTHFSNFDKVLGTWLSGNSRLLVVVYHFEKFVILEERTSAERARQFVAGVQSLCEVPLLGLCLLFAATTSVR
jgi:hypothetical protein